MDSNARLLIAFTLATAIVVGVVVSLSTGSWLFLVLAVLVHGVGTAIVLGMVGKRVADDSDKPDPVTQARLEDEAASRG